MYGHTSTMKTLTELLDSFRGTIGDSNTGGFSNPSPCPRPSRWFRPIKLFAELGNPIARNAILEEGNYVREEIKRKAHDLILNNQEAERIYLGGWEMVVLLAWFDLMHPIKLNDTTVSKDTEGVLIEMAVDGCGHMRIIESDAESFIEVVAKRKVTADSFL